MSEGVVIVHGKLPAGRRHDGDLPATPRGWSVRSFIGHISGRLRPFRWLREGDPSVAEYATIYSGIVQTMFPDAPFKRLDRLRADLFDGHVSPSTPYYNMVITSATIVEHHMRMAGDLIATVDPPASVARPFRRLVKLHETSTRATVAVLEAASRGNFDVLQDALFHLTREVEVFRHTVEQEHRHLNRRPDQTALPAPANEPEPEVDDVELPSNVIRLVRTGTNRV